MVLLHIFIYAHLPWGGEVLLNFHLCSAVLGGGGFCSIFIYAHLSWERGVLLNFHLRSLVLGEGSAPFLFMLTCPGGEGCIMLKFSYMLTVNTTVFFSYFQDCEDG